MSDLSEFLLARIAEDEAAARAAAESERDGYGDAGWIDPAFVLAECDVRRQIVADCLGAKEEAPLLPYGGGEDLADDILALLALPYADQADYRQEWKPWRP